MTVMGGARGSSASSSVRGRGTPEDRFEAILARARVDRVNQGLSLHLYFRTATNLWRQACIYGSEDDAATQYVFLLRVAALLAEVVPKHRSYGEPGYAAARRTAAAQLRDVVALLEQLKPRLKKELAAAGAPARTPRDDPAAGEALRQRAAALLGRNRLKGKAPGGAARGGPAGPAPSEAAAQRHALFAEGGATAAGGEFGGGGFGGGGFGGGGGGFGGGVATSAFGAVAGADPAAPAVGRTQYPSLRAAQEVAREAAMFRDEARAHQVSLEPLPPPSATCDCPAPALPGINSFAHQFAHLAPETPRAAGDGTLASEGGGDGVVLPPRVSPLPPPQSQVEGVLEQPAPPQFQQPQVAREATPKRGREGGEGVTSEGPLGQPLPSPAFALGEPPVAAKRRKVHVANSMMTRFLEVAGSNTASNVETCGVLAGTLTGDTLYVTHLIVPKQDGTSDSCTTRNEEEIFEVLDKLDLIALGWIHTHPTQTCFMSSIDLHTQCAWQTMMDEALAIVMAPTDGRQRFGIFRLTDGVGLQTIQRCPQQGFHAHDMSQGPLYEHCTNVMLNPGLEFQVVDIR